MAESGGISEKLLSAALSRMNITWEIDKKTEQEIRNALEEAQDYLRRQAGNETLTFESGYLRTLLLDCAWYIKNQKLGDFSQAYAGELTTLRLTEGFGCGKESDTV